MCDKCKRLKEEVASAEIEVNETAEELMEAEAAQVMAEGDDSDARKSLSEAQAELKTHQDSCADAADDWEYHQAAEAAGQISILDSP